MKKKTYCVRSDCDWTNANQLSLESECVTRWQRLVDERQNLGGSALPRCMVGLAHSVLHDEPSAVQQTDVKYFVQTQNGQATQLQAMNRPIGTFPPVGIIIAV